MALIKNGNGEIIYTAPPDQNLAQATGVNAASGFAISDDIDKLKQIQFNPTAQTGASATDITLTLPATSGTIATVGSSGSSFTTIQCPAGTSPVATGPTDTLTLASSDNSVTITGNSTTDTVNLAAQKLTTVASTDATITGSISGATVTLNSGPLVGRIRQNPFFYEEFLYATGTSSNGAIGPFGVQAYVGGSVQALYDAATMDTPGVVKIATSASGTARYYIMTEQRGMSFNSSLGTSTLEVRAKLQSVPVSGDDWSPIIGYWDQAAYGIYFTGSFNNATSTTNWVARVQTGAGTFADVDTGIAMSTSWAIFRIEYNASGHALFYINGVLKNTVTSGLPSTTQRTNISLGLDNITAAAHEVRVDYCYWGLDLVTTR
jgi:hypothetical protein